MEFVWRRAAPGLYCLRDHEGLGPALGGITSVRETGGASVYEARFMYAGEHLLPFRERGSPNTVIKLLEAEIVKRLPDATFTRKDFR